MRIQKYLHNKATDEFSTVAFLLCFYITIKRFILFVMLLFKTLYSKCLTQKIVQKTALYNP